MDNHSSSTHPLTTIQTYYALPPTLDTARFAVSKETVEARPEDRSEASRTDATKGSSPVEAEPASFPTRKETRCMRRAKRKRLLGEANGGVHKKMTKSGAQKRASSLAESESFTSTNAERGDLKVAEGGWLGSRKRVAPEEESTLEELLDRGLKLVEWDGITPHALLDALGNVVAVLAGREVGTFEDVLLEATSEFERHSMTLAPVQETPRRIPPGGKQPTRGRFHAVVTGISYGGGQTAPMQSAVPKMYQNAVRELRASKAMYRLAGFQDHVFKTFFPKIHGYYVDRLSELYRSSQSLRPPYESSVMPAAAYNLGPVTVCRPHRDSANLAFGICAITALGHFDPTVGGHLVLRELGLVVEFPPGATILIPSAVLTHYNTKLPEGSRRYSFTQYAAGSLFCYIENGLKSEQDVMNDSKLSPLEKEMHTEARRERWKQGLALFPHISDYKRAP